MRFSISEFTIGSSLNTTLHLELNKLFMKLLLGVKYTSQIVYLILKVFLNGFDVLKICFIFLYTYINLIAIKLIIVFLVRWLSFYLPD